ncbi:MAG: hypothetical protein RL186_405 [Pseudomonadota bacterium]
MSCLKNAFCVCPFWWQVNYYNASVLNGHYLVGPLYEVGVSRNDGLSAVIRKRS